MLLGDVEHVDHDDHWHKHFDQLGREVEVALEVRGINNVDDRFSFTRQEDVVTGDALIFTGGGCRRNRIDAGKVDEPRSFRCGIRNYRSSSTVTPGQLPTRWREPVRALKNVVLPQVRIADHADDMLTHRL